MFNNLTRMLRWISDIMIKDGIRNSYIKWFEHTHQKQMGMPV